MSDGLSISEGGYTAVSSDSLRDAANRALAVANLLREAVTSGNRAHDSFECMTVRLPVADSVLQAVGMSATVAQLIEVLAAQLARAADVYEAVELMIAVDMNGMTPAIENRLGALEAARPGLTESALAMAFLTGGLRNFASLSVLPRTGKEVYIVDRKITRTSNAASVAPKGAADLVKTIPTGAAQIRVDRYNMPDGSRRFVVSVSGTRALLSELDPFDMHSNADLYTGNDSTSAEAVRKALEDAGVEPEDWLLMNTHSQAAMIADRLAPDPSIDPEMVVTWGNPGERPMPSDVVNIDIKHANDPVGWLGGSEYPIPTGADGSFEVTRDTSEGRPGSGVSDAMHAHFLDAYAETGAMMDASDDPRMDALREPLAELAEAESVTTTEYVVWEKDLRDDTHGRSMAPFPEGQRGATPAPSPAVGPQPGGPLFEFTDPVAPDQIGIAPPPEPGEPRFRFGEVPVSPPEPPVTLHAGEGLPPKEDNHAGPWRL